ncbi:MAG: PAS domain-containing protein [Novosphingobium sp.]|nr:PAS domain-containing protein [Novosphingobium sp.]
MQEFDANLDPFASFQSGEGAGVAELIRSFDWSATPVGAMGLWPRSLRESVERILKERTPHFLCWGTSFVSFYNDAFAPFLGSEHPDALGKPYTTVSAAFWLQERPMIGTVMAGKSQYLENTIVHTPSRPERSFGRFTFVLTPVRNDGGQVEGFIAQVTELTEPESGPMPSPGHSGDDEALVVRAVPPKDISHG